MYVRVLSFLCRADVNTGHIRAVYRELISHARSIDGFMGSSLLMADESCRGMALMYWRDREAASSAGPQIVSLLAARINDVLDQPPEIAGYQLSENNIDFNQEGT